jgi:hypothetical protein
MPSTPLEAVPDTLDPAILPWPVHADLAPGLTLAWTDTLAGLMTAEPGSGAEPPEAGPALVAQYRSGDGPGRFRYEAGGAQSPLDGLVRNLQRFEDWAASLPDFPGPFGEIRDDLIERIVERFEMRIEEASVDHFNIDLAFYGSGWTAELAGTVAAAAEFLSDEIAAGLPDDTAPSTFDTAAGLLRIDDLLVEIELTEIDGAGGIGAQAGPTAVRSSDGVTPDGLPAVSLMQIDIADARPLADLGLFDDLVLHEMFHALGWGTSQAFLRTIGFGLDVSDPALPIVAGVASPTALAAAAADGVEPTLVTLDGFTFAPVLPVGSEVTPEGLLAIDGHWSEDVFETELMSPILGFDTYLADHTLGVLADMGYTLKRDYTQDGIDNPLKDGIDLTPVELPHYDEFLLA